MPSLDERVAYLEGRLEDHTGTVVALRSEVSAVRDDLREGFKALGARLDGLDTRSDRIDARLDRTEARIDRLDTKIDRLDDKVSRHFTWLVGIQVTVLVAVIAALLGR